MGKKCVMASLTLALICLHLSGCALRSAVIKDDQIQYNVLIADSISKQMVLNLVRERYAEMPFFLQAPTINSGFSYTASLGLSALAPEANATLITQSISTLLPSFSNSMTLSPTMTYVPLDGEKYVSGVFREISFDTFVLLHRSGWDFKTLLPMLVSRIGENYNYQKMEGLKPPETLTKFQDIVAKFQNISDRKDLEFVSEPNHLSSSAQESACTESKCSKKKSSTQDSACTVSKCSWVMKVRYKDEKEAQYLESLLGTQPKIYKSLLNEHNGRYEESFLLAPTAGMEEVVKDKPVVRFRLRSFEETLFFLAGGVTVPPGDKKKAGVSEDDEQKVGVSKGYETKAGGFRELKDPMVKIDYSSIPPAQALISVHYRDHYFYIDDTEKESKRVFALLVCLFSLQAGNFPNVSPALTISVGAGGR